MKSLFEEMGGIYRQVGDYFIPNLILPDDSDYQIGKYGRLRRNYLKNTVKSFTPTMWRRVHYSSTCPKSTKPATSVWKSLFLLWQSKKVRLKP